MVDVSRWKKFDDDVDAWFCDVTCDGEKLRVTLYYDELARIEGPFTKFGVDSEQRHELAVSARQRFIGRVIDRAMHSVMVAALGCTP